MTGLERDIPLPHVDSAILVAFAQSRRIPEPVFGFVRREAYRRGVSAPNGKILVQEQKMSNMTSPFESSMSAMTEARDAHPQAAEMPAGYSNLYQGKIRVGPFTAFHHHFRIVLREIAKGDLGSEEYARGMIFAAQVFTLDGFSHGKHERTRWVNTAYEALAEALAEGKARNMATVPPDADDDDEDRETWQMVDPRDRDYM